MRERDLIHATRATRAGHASGRGAIFREGHDEGAVAEAGLLPPVGTRVRTATPFHSAAPSGVPGRVSPMTATA